MRPVLAHAMAEAPPRPDLDQSGRAEPAQASEQQQAGQRHSEPRHAGPATYPEHRAEELTRGGRAALIRFNGQVYTLRITRQGKLLLTK